MKFYSFLIFVICLSLSLKAQIKIENISLIKPDTNLLYSDLENELKITGIDNYQLYSTSSIINIENKRIILIPKNEKSLIDTVIVLKNNKILFKQHFNICKINEIECYISGLTNHTKVGKCYSHYLYEFSVEELLKMPKIEYHIPNCFYKNLDFKVESFEIFIQKSNLSFDLKNIGGDFSDAFIGEIKKLKKGDKLFLDNIKIKGPDSKIRNVGSKEIVIKN